MKLTYLISRAFSNNASCRSERNHQRLCHGGCWWFPQKNAKKAVHAVIQEQIKEYIKEEIQVAVQEAIAESTLKETFKEYVKDEIKVAVEAMKSIWE